LIWKTEKSIFLELNIGLKPTKYQRTVIWRKINWLDIAEKIIVIADGQLKKIGTKQEVLPELLGTAKACQTLTEKL